ncbi:small-conductance mechanosensitive ion channel [Ramlibacter ginsenosidimutans]|uniref:Small-conductance mechanosensitive ion channel n=1 Tax=Ramlibacter ginsenosidimutans TaxID=502333 RepID=A0A934TW33_9BURK|nr:small-conductance mechanosensitive ion channel [Ramlibacter ginsenosidimutans]MBK6008514.1 small-conductance mechanosensitive ion channel [Ramlibacter ginsenosidimutans]
MPQITHWSEALLTSLAAALALLFSAIPKIIGFGLIIIVGWFVASLIDRGLAAILRSIHFNDLSRRAGLTDFVERMGMNTDPAGLVGLVVKWFIRLIALVVAFDALGLPAVSDVLRQLLLWLPNVVVALVVLVIGGLAARALSNVVRGAASEAGLSNTNFLAKASATVVWAFAIVVAVNQLGIATELVNTLFMAVVGAVALGIGLAFGLGGRETAAEITRKWYSKAQENSGKMKQVAQNVGEQAQQRSPGTTEAGQWPTGGYPQGGGMPGGPVPADKRHDSEGG